MMRPPPSFQLGLLPVKTNCIHKIKGLQSKCPILKSRNKGLQERDLLLRPLGDTRKMKFIAAFCFAAAMALAGSEALAADGQMLADRHIARGAKCESCHAGGNPGPVPKEQCLACHGSYAKVAEKTDKLDINPHDSHLGQIDCSKCHKGHKPAVVECNRCHDFSQDLHIR